jgi:hypothetical protein
MSTGQAVQRLWVTDLDPQGWPEAAHLVIDPDICPVIGAWPDSILTACGMRVSRWTSAGHGFESYPDGEHPMARWNVHCGLDGGQQR